MIENQMSADSKEVQRIIRMHYEWLKKCWTPDKDSYPAHGQLVVETDLAIPFQKHHKQMPEFLAEGIRVFANNELA